MRRDYGYEEREAERSSSPERKRTDKWFGMIAFGTTAFVLIVLRFTPSADEPRMVRFEHWSGRAALTAIAVGAIAYVALHAYTKRRGRSSDRPD